MFRGSGEELSDVDSGKLIERRQFRLKQEA
jgi:hypothetical protein